MLIVYHKRARQIKSWSPVDTICGATPTIGDSQHGQPFGKVKAGVDLLVPCVSCKAIIEQIERIARRKSDARS